MRKQHFPSIASIIFICFTGVAFLLHLGSQALLADEPTRALVMMEMKLSGNLLVPSINGNPYLNKPPLFNWILYGITELAGSEHEFWLRLPSVLSFFLFAFLIYFFLKKDLGHEIAFACSLATLGSLRLLFYESFLGHIDPLFCCAILTLWGTTRAYLASRMNTSYFFYAWVITLIAFFLKGLPALVFLFHAQLFIFFKPPLRRQLFSAPQWLGGLLFFIITGAYYLAYSQKAPLMPLLTALLHESSKRTVLENSWWISIRHLFLFPLECFINFAPWTFLLIVIPVKAWKKLWGEEKIRFWIQFCFLNSIVYWLSPETRPRYIMMFIPFILLPGIYYGMKCRCKASIQANIIKTIAGIMILAGIGMVAAGQLGTLVNATLSASILFLFAISLFVYLHKRSNPIRTNFQLLILIGCSLMVMRICFGISILATRSLNEPSALYKKEAERLAEKTKEHQLIIHAYTVVPHDELFYLERSRRTIVTITHAEPQKGICYFTYKADTSRFHLLDSMKTSFEQATVFACLLK
ncbi:MAG: glycosyltransferase family 39 protein [Cytophagaceae bacterium]|jgi:4-amino-4-deoxy-L-arabinose transferase-like glycosyltransferase|nr:glycosyltransferase family 39 protein [Cytophagaceae bacterium]